MPHRSTMGHLVARPATVFAIVIAIAGCGGTGPTAVPTGPATSARASPAASPSSAAAGSPTPSTAAATGSATPSASDAGWRLVQLPDAGPVGMISDIASLPGAVVAAGVGPPSGANGVAWTSVDDGATWTSEPVPGAAGVLVRLTPWGDRLLAIGESGGDTGCAHPSTVLIRVRDPGGTWAAAPSDDLFCAGGLPGAAVSGARAVVVGAGTGDTAYAWSSEDGLHWTDRSGAFDGRIPQGVAVDGSGFVAFGSGFDAAPPWSSRSADGASWPRPQPLTDLTGLTMVGNPVVLDGHPVAPSRSRRWLTIGARQWPLQGHARPDRRRGRWTGSLWRRGRARGVGLHGRGLLARGDVAAGGGRGWRWRHPDRSDHRGRSRVPGRSDPCRDRGCEPVDRGPLDRTCRAAPAVMRPTKGLTPQAIPTATGLVNPPDTPRGRCRSGAPRGRARRPRPWASAGLPTLVDCAAWTSVHVRRRPPDRRPSGLAT